LIARFDPVKGHDTFLAAAAVLAARVPGARFLLAGEGVSPENRALTDTVNSHRLQGRVHLLGRRADIPRLTAALDVASCTSLGEGFPNVVGEAMACAVPCAVTNVGDAPQLVGNPDLVVPADDAPALADLWTRLLALDASERRALGERGRHRIGAHYGIDAIARQYLALYRSVTRSD
jgi:glycosyltransferase involved in cell wall biosynthesis